MSWSGRNLESIPKPGREANKITTDIVSAQGTRYRVYERIQEDAPQDTAQVWAATRAPDAVRWPIPEQGLMQEIHDSIINTGKATPEQAVIFLKEAMKSMAAKAGEDLHLTPHWIIKKGSYFSPASLFSVENENHIWDENIFNKSIGRMMISFRITGHDQQEYVQKLIGKGKATLGLSNLGNVPPLSEECLAAVKPYFAAIDWWAAVMNNNDINKLRFGTVTTLFQSMSALRDFSFGEALGSVDNPIWSYILIPTIRDDVLSIATIPRAAHLSGSIYPYLSSLNKIHKSDMSATAKPNIHNYVNAVGCLLGSKRGQNSTHMPDSDVSFLMNAAFTAFYRFGSMDRLQIGSGRDSEAFLSYARENLPPNLKTPIEAAKILQKEGLGEISEWLSNKAKTLAESRPNSIGMFIHKNAILPVYRHGTTLEAPTDRSHPPPPPGNPPSKRFRTDNYRPHAEGPPPLSSFSHSFTKAIDKVVLIPGESLRDQLSEEELDDEENQRQEGNLSDTEGEEN